MTIAEAFSSFCEAIRLDSLTSMRTSVGEIAKKLNSSYYGVTSDTTSHIYIVGSVGRNTAIKRSSDLDVIFSLPQDVFTRFDNYDGNGQSALLQEIKGVLMERYPRTTIRGDGQVVVIEFSTFTVELVPAFLQEDDCFKYPDTHDGGSWKYTDPLSEQAECSSCEKRSNGNYLNFCHIIRSLRNAVGFPMGGLLIDTLVYNHFEENNDYRASKTADYYHILREVLSFLGGLNIDQSYWLAVGSNQQVSNTDNGSWIRKIKRVFDDLPDEVASTTDILQALNGLFGKDFPAGTTNSSRYLSATTSGEQFIEEMFPISIRYDLSIECRVTQDGWRPALLRDILRKHLWLGHHKKLDFFIASTSCPTPYQIYWKVRNVGDEAERRGMIRGQIVKTDLSHKQEHTDFYGPHYVECYLVKDGQCVARDHIDVPIAHQ